MDEVSLRAANPEDIPALRELIAVSAHGLSVGDYTREQVDGALGDAFGVDRQLIEDRTYFVIERAGELVACGGWSFRKTLFGADTRARREPEKLDPARDAAKVRAFFVHPAHARLGLGTRLLEHCEQAARRAGFRRTELMSTLPGRRLYSRFGYRGDEEIEYELRGGLTMTFIPMVKTLDAERHQK
ncbi:MAG: GNAT family N-acetyltransferase [Acidobacteriota bacterium]